MRGQGCALAVCRHDFVCLNEITVKRKCAARYNSRHDINRAHVANFHQLMHNTAGGDVDLTGAGNHAVGAELAAAGNVYRTVYDQLPDAAHRASIHTITFALHAAGNETCIVLYRNRSVDRRLRENFDGRTPGKLLQRSFRGISPAALKGKRFICRNREISVQHNIAEQHHRAVRAEGLIQGFVIGGSC